MAPRPHARSTAATRPMQRTNPIAGTVMALVLFVLGAVLIALGLSVIDRQEFTLVTHRQVGFVAGPLGFGRSEDGQMGMLGPDATRWGVGLASLGAMLGLWGVGAVFGVLRGARTDASPGPSDRGASALSLAFLLLAVCCFFPPWAPASLALYLPMVATGFACCLALRQKNSPWPKRIFPGLIGAALLAGWLGRDAWAVGIVISIFVMLLVFIHLVLLLPKLRARIMHDADKIEDPVWTTDPLERS